MSKRETLKVEAHPPISCTELHEARILTVQVQRRLRRIVVGGQLMGGDQEGRAIEWRLPLPIRPSGLTADFLEAVGITASVGAEVTPADAIGCRLYVRFDRIAGNIKPVTFTAIEEKESSNATIE